MRAKHEQNDICLAVDLDGTLIHTDTLWESIFCLLREAPLRALLLPFWLLGGRAHLKERLNEAVRLDVTSLPYRDEVIDYLRSRRASGQRIALVTAASQGIADAVAEHLGLFDDQIGTGSGRNLKGEVKRDWLVERWGHEGFDYIGDSRADLPTFCCARQSMLAAPSPSLQRKAEAQGNVTHIFQRPNRRSSAALRALRPHQWSKNLLLGVPLIMAHRLTDWAALGDLAIAILAFCMVSSATYLVNDLLDLPADRLHPHKRNRPLASGAISIPLGLSAAFALLIAGFGLGGLCVGTAFAFWLTVYLIITLMYSGGIKGVQLADVFVLASLYTIRLMAGAAATGTPVSDWLLAFSVFFFLSLAFAKRHVEAASLASNGPTQIPRRGYRREDAGFIEMAGLASGYVAVVVLALYITSPKVQTLYSQPRALWLLCALLVYWLTRVWFLTHRGEMHHDPVVFALKDSQSYLIALLAGALILAATVA